MACQSIIAYSVRNSPKIPAQRRASPKSTIPAPSPTSWPAAASAKTGQGSLPVKMRIGRRLSKSDESRLMADVRSSPSASARARPVTAIVGWRAGWRFESSPTSAALGALGASSAGGASFAEGSPGDDASSADGLPAGASSADDSSAVVLSLTLIGVDRSTSSKASRWRNSDQCWLDVRMTIRRPTGPAPTACEVSSRRGS